MGTDGKGGKFDDIFVPDRTNVYDVQSKLEFPIPPENPQNAQYASIYLNQILTEGGMTAVGEFIQYAINLLSQEEIKEQIEAAGVGKIPDKDDLEEFLLLSGNVVAGRLVLAVANFREHNDEITKTNLQTVKSTTFEPREVYRDPQQPPLTPDQIAAQEAPTAPFDAVPPPPPAMSHPFPKLNKIQGKGTSLNVLGNHPPVTNESPNNT